MEVDWQETERVSIAPLENEHALRPSEGVGQNGWGNANFVTGAYFREMPQLWLYCGMHETTIWDRASSTVLRDILTRFDRWDQ